MEFSKDNITYVLVEWGVTAKHPEGQYTKENALKYCKETTVYTVGILVGETTTTYVIAGEYNTNDNKYGDLTSVPKSCVSSVSILFERAPRKVNKKIKK